MLPKDLIRKLRKLEIVTRRLVNQQLAGQYQAVFKGRGMDFDEVRLYQAGDDIRHIDWNVSARTGEVYVKRFIEERELSVFLVVDVSASQGFGSVTQRKRDTAAEVAALLAFSAIKNNDRVGLLLFSDAVERFIPLKKGRKHVMRLISELLRHEPYGRGTSLEEAFDYLGRVSQRKSVVFVLSDFACEGYERAMHVMAQRHDVIPVVITDPMEETLPEMGLCRFVDPESGQQAWVDTSDRRVRARFSRIAMERRQRRLHFFRRTQLDSIDIYTHRPYMNALITYFRLRASRL